MNVAPAEVTPPAAARGDASTASVWRRFFHPSNRYLPPVLITCILLGGQVSFGMLESWSRTFLAIATSIVAELVLGRLVTGKTPHLASAYITGISVGILIRSPLFWPYALCAAISIMSKYALRWRGTHIWNPSNLGVSVMFVLYPAVAASLSIQWGNTLWPMLIVWCLGTVIVYRIKRLHICATYVAAFVVLSLIRSAVTGNPWLASVAPLTGPMYQLFIFFMITEPRTTVSSPRWQCVVVALVAVVEMILRLNEVIHAPYYALCIVGPAAKIIDLALQRAKKPALAADNKLGALDR